MNSIFFTLMIVAMLAVLGALGFGLFSMARGGDKNQKRSNQFMRWRLYLQGAAIVLFFLAIIFSNKG